MKQLFGCVVVCGFHLAACDPSAGNGDAPGGALRVFIDQGAGEVECTADPCTVSQGDVVAGRDEERFTVRLAVTGDAVDFDALQGSGCAYAFFGTLDGVAREQELIVFPFGGVIGERCDGVLEMPNSSSTRPDLRFDITANLLQGDEPGDECELTLSPTCQGTALDWCDEGVLERSDCAEVGARCVAGAGCVASTGGSCDPDVEDFRAEPLCEVGGSFVDCYDAADEAELDENVCP